MLALFTTKVMSTEFNCCFLCPFNLNQAALSQYIEMKWIKACPFISKDLQQGAHEKRLVMKLLAD